MTQPRNCRQEEKARREMSQRSEPKSEGAKGGMAVDNKAFNLEAFINRHIHPKWTKSERTLSYTKEELLSLVQQVIDTLKKEKPLGKLKAPCVVVGDIHGQFSDLLRIFEVIRDMYGLKKFNRHGAVSMRFMFLGDYVDRGRRSLECISLLFALKLKFPKHYCLLRGNHESRQINRIYGFWQEILDRFRVGAEEIYARFNEAFSYLPLVGLIHERILCMHGGISPKLTSFRDLDNIPWPLDEPTKSELAMDLMWADPKEGPEMYTRNVIRGVSVFFNEAAVNDVLKRLNCTLIVRAHQMMMNGYGFFADRKCITLFTAPRYQAHSNNKGAVMIVNKEGRVHFSLFNASTEEQGPQDDTPTIFPIGK